MEKETFERWLDKALTFFDRKGPSSATVDLWFQAVKDITAEALPRVYQELTELESLPRNLPGFMQAKARDWLGANPHKQARGNCECHKGVWEVACWRPELAEWVIFTVPCGPCNGREGPRERIDLLNPKFYEREPDRYMEAPPPWALIYPDKDSIGKKRREVLAFLEHHRHDRPQANNLDVEAELPF